MFGPLSELKAKRLTKSFGPFLSAATLVAANYGFTCRQLPFEIHVCLLLLGRTKIAIS
jgi:hypothetical protein